MPPQILAIQPLPKSSVIIKGDEVDQKGVITDLREFQRQQYDEFTLTTICWGSLILRDNLVEIWLVEDTDLDLTPRSIRRDKWRPGKQGPTLPISAHYYDWDIEPDTTYAVSMNMFNQEQRNKLDEIELQI